MRTVVWFRGKDLRLADHAPLHHALKGGEVIPLFVIDPHFFEPTRARELPHRIQFLLDSLAELSANIRDRGSELVLVHGRSVDVVPQLAKAWKADRVVAQRWSEPFARERDAQIAAKLGNAFVLLEGETLLPPGTLRTGAGRPYSVFTQFSNAFVKTARVDTPLPSPRHLPPLPRDVQVARANVPSLDSLGIPRNTKLQPGGESAGQLRLKTFAKHTLAAYAEARNRMDLDGTSRLSADLKFGTVSPRQVWFEIGRIKGQAKAREVFLNELVWREFAHSTLWDRPEVLTQPFRIDFSGFPWRDDAAHWDAWTNGQTGYPVVDASARQLLASGFVHNRARMISASFLTKHLLISYQRGEAHYLKYLTDGDWAQNNAGWQWSAGCGCDAQPYFRVFNPVLQGQRFDPEGAYVRRWVPELAALPTQWIHAPWEAPAAVLAAGGVTLGATYPRPIVDHPAARARFLATAKEHLQRRTTRPEG